MGGNSRARITDGWVFSPVCWGGKHKGVEFQGGTARREFLVFWTQANKWKSMARERVGESKEGQCKCEMGRLEKYYAQRRDARDGKAERDWYRRYDTWVMMQQADDGGGRVRERSEVHRL